MNGEVIFCNLCHTGALRMAPMIIEVPTDHDKYKCGQ